MARTVGRAAVALAAIVLCGCVSTMPYNSKSMIDVATTLQVPPSEITNHHRCRSAFARPTDVQVRFVDCIYVGSTEWVALVVYDARRQSYQRLAVLDLRTPSVALATKELLFGNLKQIQIDTARGHVVFSMFDQFGTSAIGQADDLLAAFEQIKGLGIPEAAPRPFVVEIPDFVYIPVYY